MAKKDKIKILILDYGLGNITSIRNVLDYLKIDSIVSNKKNDIESADAIILPGVGAFGDAMKRIRELSLDILIRNFVVSNKPILGICLGFQLLFEESEEYGIHRGLEILPGRVVKFPASLNGKKITIPNVGWNSVIPTQNNAIPSLIKDFKTIDLRYYFVHSFYVNFGNSFMTSYSNYRGIKFTSSVQKGNIYGVQFHPERSGENGIEFIKKFIQEVKRVANE